MGYREIIRGEPEFFEEPDYNRLYKAGEYFEWSYDGLFELIRGKVYDKNHAYGANHQSVSRDLAGLFLPLCDKGFCVFSSPVDVYFTETDQHWRETCNVVQPDLFVLTDQKKLQKHGCVGAPDFIAEIITRISSVADYRAKFELYQEYGVEEYWQVNLFTHSITRNMLVQGRYEVQRTSVEGEMIFPQRFPEVQVSLKKIFANLIEEDEIPSPIAMRLRKK